MPRKISTRMYVFVAVFIISLILSFLIIAPFMTPLIAGLVFALMFYPVARVLDTRIRNRSATAVIVTMLVVLLLALPLIFVVGQIGPQAREAYTRMHESLTRTTLVPEGMCAGQDSLVCAADSQYRTLVNDPAFIYYRDLVLLRINEFILKSTPAIFFAIPKLLIDVFIFVLVLFYALRDGKLLIERIESILPLKPDHKKRIILKVSEITHAIMYGHVITALVQGLVGVIGFYIFGLPNPVLLGIAIMFAALVPPLGASLIWVPVAILTIFDGLAHPGSPAFMQGIGFFFYGLLIISTVDNIIKPKIMGDRANVNQVIILLGLLGGIALFGIIGIVVGPLILALTTTTLMEIYEEEKHEITR